jgi:hypothetical protein
MLRRLELGTKRLLRSRLPLGARHMVAIWGVALLVVAGGAFRGAMAALPAPLVEIVVCDGATLPCTVIAGCSEPDCLGLGSGGTFSGVVTNSPDVVGWSVSGGDPKKRVYLYVDGRQVSSARSGRLLTWSPTTVGPHTLQGMAYNSSGIQGWSTPLTICYMHC